MKDSKYIVEYEKKDGTIQKAILDRLDQDPQLEKSKRLLLRLVDNDIVEIGKMVVKSAPLCKVIGYVN